MAPLRSQRAAARANRNQPDTDVLSGMPVRQYVEQSVTVNSAPPKPVRGGPKKDTIWSELPMPKGSELYPPHSLLLLRQARMPYIPPEDRDEPEEGDEDADGEADDAFTIKKWIQVPQGQERPEIKLLADRPRSLATLYGGTPGASVMRKVKVKKINSQGNESFFDVLVPEGIKLEGEVAPSEAPAVSTEPVAPGTVVEGVGVANAQGVVIAEAVTPPTNRRKPPPPKRKKHGPGRGRKKKMIVETMGADGVMEITEAATPSRTGDDGDDDEDDDGDDDGREDGELSDGTGVATPDPRGPTLPEPPRSVPTDAAPSLVPPVVVVVEADQQPPQIREPNAAPSADSMDIDVVPVPDSSVNETEMIPAATGEPNEASADAEAPVDSGAMDLSHDGEGDDLSTAQPVIVSESTREPIPPSASLPEDVPALASEEHASKILQEDEPTATPGEPPVEQTSLPAVLLNDAPLPVPDAPPADPATVSTTVSTIVSAAIPEAVPEAVEPTPVEPMQTDLAPAEAAQLPAITETSVPEPILEPAPEAPVTEIAAILDAPAVPIEGDVVSEVAPTVNTNESRPSIPETDDKPKDIGETESRTDVPVPKDVITVGPAPPLPEVQVGESAANVPDDDLKLAEPAPADAATAAVPVSAIETEPQQDNQPELSEPPKVDSTETPIGQIDPPVVTSVVAEEVETKVAAPEASDAPSTETIAPEIAAPEVPALTALTSEAPAPETPGPEVTEKTEVKTDEKRDEDGSGGDVLSSLEQSLG